MNPENYNNQVPQNTSAQQAGQVYGGGTTPPPQSGPMQNPLYQPPQENPKGTGSNRKILIILGVLLAVFVLTFIVYLLIPGAEDKKQETEQQQTAQPQTLVKEPSAIDIEDVNNSISDDVSNLADDNDFPTDTLTDEKLEL